jgi:hypothetical protein
LARGLSMRMIFKLRLPILVVLAGFVLSPGLRAQSDDNNVPLGDVARALRKERAKKDEPQAPVVIDNDNFSQVMQQVEKDRLQGKVNFTFDGAGKDIRVSSPDVTCNLAFNADSSALLNDPFVARDLPRSELAKLDGPATIRGDSLQVTIHNGSNWTIKEITVGLTILRRADTASLQFSSAKLLPASAGAPPANDDSPSEKPSDLTVLYHLKGSAAPASTTVFQQDLGAHLAPDQDWHWAIVQAQGVPAR